MGTYLTKENPVISAAKEVLEKNVQSFVPVMYMKGYIRYCVAFYFFICCYHHVFQRLCFVSEVLFLFLSILTLFLFIYVLTVNIKKNAKC